MIIKNGLIKRSRLADVVLINMPKAFVLYVPTCTAFNNIQKNIKFYIRTYSLTHLQHTSIW